MNDESQLVELRQYTKHQLACMVLDLREQVRMPQDRKAALTLSILLAVFLAGVIFGTIL